MKRIVLAFDIETTGSRPDNGDIIGIGASVVDDDFVQLDALFLGGYFPNETVFEPRCKEEFWDKNTHVLQLLEYKGSLTREQRKQEMTKSFQNFRAKWEQEASRIGAKFEICCDNTAYDAFFINAYICKYTTPEEDLPLPYNASDQRYRPFWETHAQQRGLLMLADPCWDCDWGLQKRIAGIFDVPTCPVNHDHNPSNDAYTIAFEQQVLFAIRDGRIKGRQLVETSPVEKSI